MTTIISFGSIVEKNGKTIRENNLALQHRYPVGALVEFSWGEHGDDDDSCINETKVRAYICAHTRDCDGSPLYHMSMWPPQSWKEVGCDITAEEYTALSPFNPRRVAIDNLFKVWFHNYGEDSLKLVKLP